MVDTQEKLKSASRESDSLDVKDDQVRNPQAVVTSPGRQSTANPRSGGTDSQQRPQEVCLVFNIENNDDLNTQKSED